MNTQLLNKDLPPPRFSWKETRELLIMVGLFALSVYLVQAISPTGNEALILIAILYFWWESVLATLLVVFSAWGLATRAAQKSLPIADSILPNISKATPAVSVLIAAYNELSCIAPTVNSVLQQTESVHEIIIASDGSDDGMNELLVKTYHLSPNAAATHYETTSNVAPRIILLCRTKNGKGASLNAALAIATGEVVVTLDADTLLEPDAIHELAHPFTEPRVAAMGGFIFVRNSRDGTWITRRQYVEYLKNFLWRIGLARAGLCLQVSGAFGAFRRELIINVGGFSQESLVEDYEIIYRLHQQLRQQNPPYFIGIAPQAIAYTDGPETVSAFIRQRTRWFAGFLHTLRDYRSMILNPRYGRIGLFMLPIKVVDAFLPIWGLGSLGILLLTLFFGHSRWSEAALMIFGVKWFYDIVLSAILLSYLPKLFPGRELSISRGAMFYFIATEGLIFNWFRQAAVVGAYGWVIRGFRQWHQPRWNLTKKLL